MLHSNKELVHILGTSWDFVKAVFKGDNLINLTEEISRHPNI
jgi:hypothetical protein